MTGRPKNRSWSIGFALLLFACGPGDAWSRRVMARSRARLSKWMQP